MLGEKKHKEVKTSIKPKEQDILFYNDDNPRRGRSVIMAI